MPNEATIMRAGESYRDKRSDPVYACNKCKCEWFERVHAARYVVTTLVLGQEPAQTGTPFVFLRCVRCGELHEPNLQFTPTDSLGKEYQALTKLFSEKEPGNEHQAGRQREVPPKGDTRQVSPSGNSP